MASETPGGEGMRESNSDMMRTSPGINSHSYSEPTYKAEKRDDLKSFSVVCHVRMEIISESVTLAK